MIVHFIGGPHHGVSEALTREWCGNTIQRISTPHTREPIYSGGSLPLPSISYETHEYTITRRMPRYLIAEYRAPKVEIGFSIELEVDPYDSAANYALRKFADEAQRARHGNVRCVSWTFNFPEGIFCIDLAVVVEGPEDPTALKLAAEEAQSYLDEKLPTEAGSIKVRRASASSK